MLFPCTQRHYAVCALRDLPAITHRDPDFWNVISVLETSAPRVQAKGMLETYRLNCDDITEIDPTQTQGQEKVKSQQLNELFQFADRLFGQPILVHCLYGSSRSPGVALLLLIRDMRLDGFSIEECVRESIDFLLTIRPKAMPNAFIVEQGLPLIFDAEELEKVTYLITHHVR
jgi:predicted protein tyrosine phosphatase